MTGRVRSLAAGGVVVLLVTLAPGDRQLRRDDGDDGDDGAANAAAVAGRPGGGGEDRDAGDGGDRGDGGSDGDRGERAEPRTFTLVATGDVLLHSPLWRQAGADAAVAGLPGLDFGPLLAGVRPIVEAADVAICHLETPLAPAGGPYAGYPVFSVPPEIVPALDATGYDACTTASNHSFDGGGAGIDRTLAALDAAGLGHAGSARSPAEAGTITYLRAGGARLALLSYAYGFNGIPAPGGQAWRANPIDEARILADAALARAQGADVVVVALHWGSEYQHDPNPQQADLGPRLIASPDIDLLLGHHAHVVQPLEAVGGEWIVYGMGNLVATHSSPGAANHEGILVRFTFQERADGWAITNAEYAPLLMVVDRGPIRLLDVDRALADPATDGSLRDRLVTARDRTAAVVASRGAADAGLRPIAA